MYYEEREPQVKLFLESIAKFSNITKALEASELPRTTVYRWKKNNEEFAARWVDAYESATDKLVSAAWGLALDELSEKMIIFLLKARRPEVYGDNIKVKTDTKLEIVYDKDWGK